jgi:pimeloyl-ACP methyl ester carboxylesterase
MPSCYWPSITGNEEAISLTGLFNGTSTGINGTSRGKTRAGPRVPDKPLEARRNAIVAVFVVAHGAWSAAWAWKKMRPLLRAAGHEIWTPTYTGLGERAHLASPAVDLDTHIKDVVGVLEMEDLSNVVLIGHSYGGMVATGVADRARDRIAQVIYLDAFVPQDGQSLFDLQDAPVRDHMRALADKNGDGWRLPPNPMPPDTPEADVAWATPRRMPQPIKTFEQVLQLSAKTPPPPRSYIYCRRSRPDDVFRQFLVRAQNESGWRHFEMDASHNPHITVPQELMAILQKIVG